MQVILLERITGLGNMGETATVKPGYARNFLIPQGKALPATESNMAKYEAKRKELETQNTEAKKTAEAMKSELGGVSIKIARQASETGQLFGSVKSRDIEAALAEQKHEIARSIIQIGTPIKEVGEFEVKVALHPEVSFTLPVVVERQSA